MGGGTYGSEPAVLGYAGFWRRFWGLHADSVLVQVATAIVNLIAFLILILIVGLDIQTCGPLGANGFHAGSCGLSEGMMLALGGSVISVNLVVWYRVIPRAMGRDGATWGMHELGLRIHSEDTDSILGAGLALWRAILAGVFQVVPTVAATVVFVLVSRDGELDGSMVSSWIVVVVALWLLPTCWSLFDSRRQTLYDKAVGSVVLSTHEVNWPAVAAWAFAFMVPVFPLAIGLGHAAKSLDHRVRGLRGGGLASAALFVGYLQLIVVVGFVLLRISVG
ncbi:MAG: RDD family protein [Microthrixaceae bacterium]|nr:RDD family protein [Microthrixaceae bacterium]